MAAAPDAHSPELIELRHLTADALNPLLEEESRSWRDLLQWDFSPSAELVRRFVRMQALSGYALQVGTQIVGYAYYVCEDRKGLVGDLYLSRPWATPANEALLIEAVLDPLFRSGTVQRVESQLMMLNPATQRYLPHQEHLNTFPRYFMLADLTRIRQHPPRGTSLPVAIDRWAEKRQDEAALVIADAYYRHVDSQINDQYRSIPGARRFLLNIVQYPGCGAFFGPASFLAFQPVSHKVCGLVLASTVAGDVGHITQICVSPSVKGSGVGYELMRRALCAFAERGYRYASLTVTAGNRDAVRLYEQMGFQVKHKFSAFVWDRFRNF